MPPRRKQASKPKQVSTKVGQSSKPADDKDPKKTTSRGRKRNQAGTPIPSGIPIKKEKKAGDVPSKASTSAEATSLKKIKFSGRVPVDEHCTQCSTGYHVFSQNGNVYNAMLNQTNIGANNNKYFVLQVLQHDTDNEYVVWFRWGRVGKVAGTTFHRHGGNAQAAKEEFEKKFRDKTGFVWVFRRSFIKQKGKYDLLQMDYGAGDDDGDLVQKYEKSKEKEKVKSKLDKRVADVIELIFDVREFEATVKEMEFDVKKAPLGKLTPKQIKAGYESLKKVENCIRKKKFGDELVEACSEFYTKIPHDFGMKTPPLIKTTDELKAKIQLLETLGEIQIAIQMIKEEKDGEEDILDVRYNSLGCKLIPCDSSNEEFKMVKNYVAKSHGSTHNQYILKVENVYKVEREQDEKRFKKNVGNRMLLWHGSRLTNWCGILKQGLRIAPPEAPVTGYMFGKGVYFADMVSKSANYCCTNQRQPTGFLLLCEVALGKTSDKISCDFNASKLPAGCYSTKGLGTEVPDPKGYKTLDCGTIVPLGKPRVTQHKYFLRYNEYIVYDVAQIRPRYLVKAHFSYKGW